MARKQFCQSCSMPLDGKDNGTEKDGSKSQKYCNMCYQEGKFLDPDLTMDEMIVIVDNALKEKGWGRVRRYFARGFVPKLERWQKN